MKIFGIGLSRTGNASLAAALGQLGYSYVHFPTSISEVEANDALVDTTISAGFKFLDLMYPGSKFILTLRDVEPWLRSCENYWSKRAAIHHTDPTILQTHRIIYGTSDFSRDAFLLAHSFHLSSVYRHFAGRDNLLELNIAKGDGWETLCPFLGKPIPEEPFPHRHKETYDDAWDKPVRNSKLPVGAVKRPIAG